MGLLIHTSFDTPQGIPVSSVYSRITCLTCEFVYRGEVRVIIKQETHLSREKKNAGYARLSVPSVPEYIVINTPLTSGWNDLAYLYAQLKGNLESAGFVVEDILEPVEMPSTES